nr:hypothetical protein [Tanacetum cinerariifolium]
MLVPHSDGSGTPTKPYHTPSLEAQYTSPTAHSLSTLPPITIAPIPTVIPSDTPLLRQYTKRARIAQSSALPPIADEPASPLRDVSQGDACPTDSSLDAEQDMANIDKTYALPYDLQRKQSDMVSKFEAQEVEITMLKARVKLLEDREGGLQNDLEMMPQSRGGVSTGSDVVPTAGLIFATATVVTPYIRRKGKEKMIEFETSKKKKIQEQIDIQMARQLEEEMERHAQRMNEQIARDVEIARIHAEEEL